MEMFAFAADWAAIDEWRYRAGDPRSLALAAIAAAVIAAAIRWGVLPLLRGLDSIDRYEPRLARHPVWATIVLCAAALMTTLDGTMIIVAAPVIAKELDASASEMAWTVNAYGVTSVGLLILSGCLGARFGRRRMLTIGCIVFGAGCVAATVADTPEALIGTRVLLGIGGALTFPNTLGMLGELFGDPRKTRAAITAWSLMAAVGYAAGTPLAGWLLSYGESRWPLVFVVGIVFAALMLFSLASEILPKSREPSPPRMGAMQIASMALATVGPLALVWGVIAIPEGVDLRVVASLVGGLALCGVFVAIQMGSKQPVLDLSLMRQRAVVGGVVTLVVAYVAAGGTFYVLPQYFQGVLGYSPLQTGVRMLPVAIGLAIGMLAERMLGKVSSDAAVVTGGLTLGACALLGWSQVPADAGYPLIAVLLGTTAFVVGLVQPAVTHVIVGHARSDQSGDGATLNVLACGLATVLGVAFAHLTITGAMHSRMGPAIKEAGLTGAAADQARQHVVAVRQVVENGVAGGDKLMATAITSFVDSLQLWFLAAGGTLAIVAVAVFFLLRRRELPSYDNNID